MEQTAASPKIYPAALRLLYTAIGAGLILLVAVHPSPHGRPFAHLLLFFAWLVPLSVAYDAGHVIAAMGAGMRVFEVRLGVGPLLARPRIRGVCLELRLLPIACAVRFASPTPTRARLVTALVGGPLTVALAFMSVALAGGAGASASVALSALFWASLFVLFTVLCPVVLRGRRSVGLNLVALLRDPEAILAAVRLSYPLLEAEALIGRDDLPGARQVIAAARATWPAAVELRHGLALIELQGGDAKAAYELLREDASTAPTMPHVANNLAYTIASLPEPTEAELAAADDWMCAALRSLAGSPATALTGPAGSSRTTPDLRPFWGTYGAVLAREGRFAEAHAALSKARRASDPPGTRAANDAWLALATAAMTGNPEAAGPYLARARRARPSAYEIPLVEGLLARRQPPRNAPT